MKGPKLPALLTLAALPLGAQTDAAIRAVLRDQFLTADLDYTYATARVDLNGDGKREVIVYMTSHDFCGSGGCSFFILTPRGDSFVQVPMDLDQSHLPIRALGKNSLSFVLGGGGVPLFETEIRFDKDLHASGDIPLKKKVPGRIFIDYDMFKKAKLAK